MANKAQGLPDLLRLMALFRLHGKRFPTGQARAGVAYIKADAA